MVQKLILLEDVEDLGRAGDEIKVAPGYARNYLLPKGLAEKVTPGALRQIEARKERIEAKRKDELEIAQALAVKIAETELTIAMQAGEDEKLFGSVNAAKISEALEAEGISIESSRIKLEESIKELGVFTVDIKLHTDVMATAKFWIVRT